ncbi:hypothetical protein KHA80_02510 [Anaerobacillus sp. HL2]|nr:hypothetical protein KHA80_02510 [Anaerobacillus sp. HL2]
MEGNSLSQDRITVQVSKKTDQFVQVKAIVEVPKTTTPTAQTEASNINQALRSLGVNNPLGITPSKLK